MLKRLIDLTNDTCTVNESKKSDQDSDQVIDMINKNDFIQVGIIFYQFVIDE